jgi:hypothetical protein
VAEHLKRPLYVLSSLELSTTPTTLEKKLGDILKVRELYFLFAFLDIALSQLAMTWDAVVLTDEAKSGESSLSLLGANCGAAVDSLETASRARTSWTTTLMLTFIGNWCHALAIHVGAPRQTTQLMPFTPHPL